MKAMTLNVHSHARVHVEETYREQIAVLADHIINQNIDVIALQECSQTGSRTKVITDEFCFVCNSEIPITDDNCAWMLAQALKERGYHYYWAWCPIKIGYDIYDEGCAVFSIYPISEIEEKYVSGIQDYHNWKSRKILGCKVNVNEEYMWFYSVHLGWWNDEAEPFQPSMDRVQEIVWNKKENVFLMGDFNSPANMTGQGYDYMRKLGWKDSYMYADRKDSGITVPEVIDGWESCEDDGMRIDYIWSKDVLDVLESQVMFNGQNGPVISDHFAVSIHW